MRRCLPGAVFLLVSVTGFAACSTEDRTFGGPRAGEGGEPASASGGDTARGGGLGDSGSTSEEAGRPGSNRGGSAGSGGSQTSDAGEDGVGGEVTAGGSGEGGTNGAGTGNAGKGGTLNPAGGSGGTLSGGTLGAGGKTSGGSSSGGTTSNGGGTGVGGSKGGTTSLGGTPGAGGTPTFGGLTGSGGAGTVDICELQKPIKGAPTPACSDRTTIANGGGTLLEQTYYLSRSNCDGYFNGAATVFVSEKQYYMRFWVEYRKDLSIEGTISSGTLLLQPGARGTITVTEMCDRRNIGTVQTGSYEQSSNSLILTFPDNQLVWLIPS